MTSDLVCPSTYHPLGSSSRDSGPDVSFGMSASSEYLSGLACASLAEYKIPLDLHPRLPSEEFVMSELPDDAIGSLLSVGSLGLNKVVTFEVLYRSLQIEPTVTLFRIFQTLCKQGHWFSFGKRCAPSLVCIDDNRSCMKHWKSGFFLIDRIDIPDYMSWRHSKSAINDLKPPAGSFNMEDVRRLSAHVVKLRDIPKGVLVLSGLSHVWKSQTCDPVLRGANGNGTGEEPHHNIRPTLQRLPFYCTPPAIIDVVIPDPTPKDLTASNTSAKVFAKAEASQKRKASTSGAASKSDDDDDAVFEIPIITLIRSATVIPSLGNQVGGSAAPVSKDLSTRDSWGKGGVAGNCEFSRKKWDAPHQPTLTILTKEVFEDPSVCKTVVDQFSTLGEMVEIEALSSNQLTAEMSVFRLHKQVAGLNDKLSSSDAVFAKSKAKRKERKKKIKFLTKSLDNLHAEVARLSADLNWDTVLEAEKDEEILRLKATPPEFASFFWGQFQCMVRKFLASDDFSRVQAELLSLAANAGFEHRLSMHRTKEEFDAILKKISHFVPRAHGRLAKASSFVAQTDYAFLNTISKHAVEPLSVILQLEPEKLARLANVHASKDARVSPYLVKESTVTPASKSLELPSNVIPDLTASNASAQRFFWFPRELPKSERPLLPVLLRVMLLSALGLLWPNPLGEPGVGSTVPVAEDPSTRDSQRKGIMTDAAVALPVGVSRPRPSSGPASSFRVISGDAIYRDFFPISHGPYYAIYPEGGVARNEPSVCKLCGGALARYRGRSSHHDISNQIDARLKGYQEKFASLNGLESQVFGLHKQVASLNDKLSSSDAAFSKSKAKGKERKKKIKSLTKSLDNLHAEVACIFADLTWATVLEAEKDQEILRLKATPPEYLGRKHEELAHLVNVHVLRDSPISPPLVKGSTVTPTSKSLELPSNVIPASSTAALEPNEEWVNAMVDGKERCGFSPLSTVAEMLLLRPYGV
ncbi:hypothetical protein Tco_0594979 [Tanacetum coccineum]